MSWRDHIAVHPEAAKMRPHTKFEFEVLCRSITEFGGLTDPVVLLRTGNKLEVLDGCTRLDALEKLGHPVLDEEHNLIAKHETIENVNGFDAAAYVRAHNIAHRHMSRVEIRALLEQQVEEHPEKTDRQIAQETGVGRSTVNRARQSNDPVGHKKERREASGRRARGRKPGSKSAPVTSATPRMAGSDANAAKLRKYTGRQTAVVEALVTLQGATEKSLSVAPVDPADIAAQWHDYAGLASIIGWLRKVLDLIAVRQGA
jgi:hypothetical protein